MHEENYQEEQTKDLKNLAVLSELEQVEKRTSIALGRAESLYSRLRSVMGPNVQAVNSDGPSFTEPEASTDQQRIAKRLMNVKKVIQTTIDLMSEIEARLEL